MSLTAERLRELVVYNPLTGEFTSRFSRGGVLAGSVLGNINKILGYVIITIDRKKYYGHRLVWLYVYGEWPPDEIDHENLNKSDNRFFNIRESSSLQNKANRSVRKDNSLGVKGVHQTSSGSFRVCIISRGAPYHRKCYKTLDAAKAAFREKYTELYGPYGRVA